jgi:glycerol-3-phosphate acyltransferase PlsY
VPVVVLLLVVLLGYLIGSIPVAGAVARRRAAVDLREVGDRNPGYWNAKETLGRRAALPVFVGDTAKGATAAAIGLLAAGVEGGADDRWWLAYVATGAAMVGHAFPVFAGFRGGRSVLTFAGGAVVHTPIAAAISIALLLVALAVGRDFGRAARIGIAVLPVVQLVVEGPYRTAATGVLMTFIGLRFAQAALADRRASGDAAVSPVSDPGA